MCLSSETRAWGVINCREGGRLSGAVILQMIPASNVEAGNGSMKRHTYTAPARLGHILPERNAGVGGAVGGLPTACKGSFIKKKVASPLATVLVLSQDYQMDLFIHLERC